jgi:hypothetical protein
MKCFNFLCFHQVTLFQLTYKVPTTSIPSEFTIHATSGKLQKPPIQKVKQKYNRSSTRFTTSARTLNLHLQTGSVVPHPSMYK